MNQARQTHRRPRWLRLPGSRASGIVEPCLPSPAKALPAGLDWLHEIKLDGFRILARHDCRAS